MRLRNERLTWREIDGEIVALDLETSSYFNCNQSASVLLKRLAEAETTEEQLIDLLLDEFDVDPERASTDVREFLGTLDEQGLLDIGSAP